jgi:hypothetical protein
MTRAFVFSLVVPLTISPAWAQGDPACPGDLAATDASFEETLQRLDSAFKTKDQTQRCDAIRHHIEVMRAAGDVFDRCTTGHEREENLGQVIGTIADFQDVAAEMGCP